MILTIVLWGILGGLLGLLVFLSAPMVAQMAGIDYQYKVGQWYFGLSMKAYRRVMCLVRPNNDLELFASDWDEESQGEKVDKGDHPSKFKDPKGSVARCMTVPFTMAFTDRATIIHPLDARVGSALERLEQQGRKFVKFAQTDDNGEHVGSYTAHNAHLNTTSSLQGTDLQSARKTLNESHQPGDAHKTEQDVEKSQRGFKSKDMLGMGLIIMACMGGALTAWVIYSNTGDTESAVTVPIQVGAMML